MIEPSTLASLARKHGLSDASIVLDPAGEPGGGVALAPDAPIYPASMIKLPIALALALRIESGAFRSSDEVDVDAANLTANDAPSPFVVDRPASLATLCAAMLSASDNVATNVLIDVLGRERIGPALAQFGVRATGVRRKLSGSLPLIDDPLATGRNSHPAGDAAALLHEVERRRRAGPCPLYDALAAQRWNDKLSRGFRAGDQFAHKTGDTDEVSHDGGLLTLADGRRFVLVVYTALPSNATTDAAFGAFAAGLRALLSGAIDPASR